MTANQPMTAEQADKVAASAGMGEGNSFTVRNQA
jgi:hypothetical protein